MTSRQDVYEPVPPREAFEGSSAAARRTQAALLLSVGAAVGADTDHVPEHEQFPLPPLSPMAHPAPMPLAVAVRGLNVSVREYRRGLGERIPQAEASRLTHELYERPVPETAAALVEAGMQNESRLVRTAAAVSAIDTTGPREDVVAQLEESATARDPDTRELARTGLARAVPGHPMLDRFVVGTTMSTPRSEPSNTAVVSHGTWSARTRWWRPGGDFHTYLDDLQPSLHVHDESFGWSGAYSEAARDLAAADMIGWIGDQQLDRPDWFAHSHGATVANLATQRGAELSRLVMMGAPVHAAWLPDLAMVDAVIDVRVRADLVILADRGAQRLPARIRNQPKVTEVRNGWFSHSATHDPAYWDDHDIPSRL